MKRILFFDIETAPLENVGDYIEVPDAPGNYKDEEKIIAWKEAKRQDLIAKAALDPDLAQVIAIGCATLDRTLEYKYESWTWFEYPEADILDRFWQAAQGPDVFVGFNQIGFDWPMILRRSMANRICVPFIPDLRRYQLEPNLDLMQVLCGWSPPYKGLDFFLSRYGLPTKTGTGEMAATMGSSELDEYLKSDVDSLARLAVFANGYYYDFEALHIEVSEIGNDPEDDEVENG